MSPSHIKRSRFCSAKCRSAWVYKINDLGKYNNNRTPWNKGKQFLQVTGSKNNNWKGGITKLTEKIRKCFLYSQWRIAIFKER